MAQYGHSKNHTRKIDSIQNGLYRINKVMENWVATIESEPFDLWEDSAPEEFWFIYQFKNPNLENNYTTHIKFKFSVLTDNTININWIESNICSMGLKYRCAGLSKAIKHQVNREINKRKCWLETDLDETLDDVYKNARARANKYRKRTSTTAPPTILNQIKVSRIKDAFAETIVMEYNPFKNKTRVPPENWQGYAIDDNLSDNQYLLK